MISIVLADDHPIVLDGLVQLLELEPDMRILARCTSAAQALKAVRERCPDILVLDLAMPGMSGIEVLRELRRSPITTRVVVLTASADESQVLEVLHCGAEGMILKEMASSLIVKCIRKVQAGGQWLETRSVARAMERLLQRERATGDLAQLLTGREMEIARLVAEGLRNKDIAARLYVSEGTVKIHLHRIFEKLRVASRLELAAQVRARGLV